MDHKTQVLAVFESSNSMMKSQEVAEATGLDKAEVTKLIASLKKEGQLMSPKRCYYQISKDN